MYRLLIYLLQPYTFAYVITGVAIVSLWRKRQATTRPSASPHPRLRIDDRAQPPGGELPGLGSLEWSFPPLKSSRRPMREPLSCFPEVMSPPNSVRQEAAWVPIPLHRCLYAAERLPSVRAHTRSRQWRNNRSRVSSPFACPSSCAIAHQIGSGCFGPEAGTQLPIHLRERRRMPQTARSTRHPEGLSWSPRQRTCVVPHCVSANRASRLFRLPATTEQRTSSSRF